MSVHCPKCGARYETTLPASGVRRIRRCGVCNRTGLEVVGEGDPAAPTAERAVGAGDRPDGDARR